MLEEKLTRMRKLIEQRDKIDAELSAMLGMDAAPKRGRPRKDAANSSTTEMASAGSRTSAGPSGGQSTANDGGED